MIYTVKYERDSFESLAECAQSFNVILWNFKCNSTI